MGLSAAAKQILLALQVGASLKAHRTVDGVKQHKVHPLQGDAFMVPASAVRELEKRAWLRSNMKFPAATYLLTQAGSHANVNMPTRWWRLPRLRHRFFDSAR